MEKVETKQLEWLGKTVVALCEEECTEKVDYSVTSEDVLQCSFYYKNRYGQLTVPSLFLEVGPIRSGGYAYWMRDYFPSERLKRLLQFLAHTFVRDQRTPFWYGKENKQYLIEKALCEFVPTLEWRFNWGRELKSLYARNKETGVHGRCLTFPQEGDFFSLDHIRFEEPRPAFLSKEEEADLWLVVTAIHTLYSRERTKLEEERLAEEERARREQEEKDELISRANREFFKWVDINDGESNFQDEDF